MLHGSLDVTHESPVLLNSNIHLVWSWALWLKTLKERSMISQGPCGTIWNPQQIQPTQWSSGFEKSVFSTETGPEQWECTTLSSTFPAGQRLFLGAGGTWHVKWAYDRLSSCCCIHQLLDLSAVNVYVSSSWHHPKAPVHVISKDASTSHRTKTTVVSLL